MATITHTHQRETTHEVDHPDAEGQAHRVAAAPDATLGADARVAR